MTVLDLLLGRPLASDESRGEQIGSLVGIPIFGLDALSSAAYGPEAALTLLIPLGAVGISYIIPISMSIIVNGLGALATGVTVVVVLIAKFTQGAWVTMLLIPSLLVAMVAVRRHYHRVFLETRTLVLRRHIGTTSSEDAPAIGRDLTDHWYWEPGSYYGCIREFA